MPRWNRDRLSCVQPVDRERGSIVRRTASLTISAALLLGASTGCAGPRVSLGSGGQALAVGVANAGTPAAQADVDSVAASLADFAGALFQQVSAQRPDDPNLLLSPASIQQVLVLMLAATSGTTNQQLRQALRVDLPDERFYPAVAALWRQVAAAAFTFRTANWGLVNQTVRLNADYVDLVGKHLAARFSSESFDDPGALAARINKSVADRTEAMIKELVTPLMLGDPALMLVMLNAVYFKGDWVHPFDGQVTQAPFTTWLGDRRTVPMMQQDSVTSYVRGDGFIAVELPYRGGASMLIVMPDVGRFDEVADTLANGALDQIRASIATADGPGTTLMMPRFSLATADPLDLRPAISALGAPELFQATADWAPLLTPPDSKGKVSFLVHKATVNVDQDGTEAAGATGGGIVGLWHRIPATPPIVLDHPFIATIQDTASEAVLFMARIGDPTSQGTQQ